MIVESIVAFVEEKECYLIMPTYKGRHILDNRGYIINLYAKDEGDVWEALEQIRNFDFSGHAVEKMDKGAEI